MKFQVYTSGEKAIFSASFICMFLGDERITKPKSKNSNRLTESTVYDSLYIQSMSSRPWRAHISIVQEFLAREFHRTFLGDCFSELHGLQWMIDDAAESMIEIPRFHTGKSLSLL